MKRVFISMAMLLCSLGLFAQSQFVGEWKTIDDKTKKPAGVVNIYQGEDGLFYGKLVNAFGPDKSAIGTMIVKGMKYDNGELVGGKIYDPQSGNTYYCTIKYDAKAKALNLRGSLDKRGLIGRSQTWIKE